MEMNGTERHEAYVRLLAAAPDLLAALEMAVKELKAWQKDHGDDIKTQEAITFASAAIAKTGDQP